MPGPVRARQQPGGRSGPANRGLCRNDEPPPPRPLPRPRPRRRAARSADDDRTGRNPNAAAWAACGPGAGDRGAGDGSAGGWPAGARAAGPRAAGGCPAGPRTAGPRTAGGWPVGPRAAGGWPTAPRAAGPRAAGGWPAGPRAAGGWPAGPWAAGARTADVRGAPGALAPDRPRGTARTHRRPSRRPSGGFPVKVGEGKRFLVRVGEGNGREAGLPPLRAGSPAVAGWLSRRGSGGYGRVGLARMTRVYQAPPMARPSATASSSARALDSSPGPGPCKVGD